MKYNKKNKKPKMNNKKKIKEIEKKIMNKISHDIFNINSRVFIKNYLLSLKKKFNKEIINFVSNYIDILKFKSLFRNVRYSLEYKKMLEMLPLDKNLKKYKKIIANLIEYIIINNFEKFYKFLIEYFDQKNRIFSFYELSKSNPELFSNIKSWYIFGCPMSKDVDICIIVNKKYEGVPLCPNYNSVKKIAKYFVKEKKDLDFNFITIDENERRITSMKKGHEEIANILCFTYKYHNQIYKLPKLDCNVTVNYLDKMRSIAKLIIENLEHFRDDYEKIRKEKKKFS